MNKFKKQEVNFSNIQEFYGSAVKKFVKAKKILMVDEETAYQVFYESMLKASLALMLSYGQRPRSLPGHHVNIIEFSAKKLGRNYLEIINTFDKMRRKRNQMIYEADIEITESEAKNALKTAEEYLAIISKHVNSNNPQLELKFK